MRKVFHDEFNHLYIFNLRGDQRTQGENSKREGGKIFGSGSRTPIAISILVKDGSELHQIHYKDVGDYLSRDEKLDILKETRTVANVAWEKIVPDGNNDWINQRDEKYEKYLSLDGGVFESRTTGVTSQRDSW